MSLTFYFVIRHVEEEYVKHTEGHDHITSGLYRPAHGRFFYILPNRNKPYFALSFQRRRVWYRLHHIRSFSTFSVLPRMDIMNTLLCLIVGVDTLVEKS